MGPAGADTITGTMDDTPTWLNDLLARADQPPLVLRERLWLQATDAVIGSIEPLLARHMAEADLPIRPRAGGWQVDGPGDAALAVIARWLHERELSGAWRNELLAVPNEHGERQALIERAAVRPLGITTVAVHLVGYTGDGRVWVQQRAFDKATDPGQWDTLSGGLLSVNETVASALHRETWEEAGLEVAALRQVRPLGRQLVRRPLDELGYMVEQMEMFEAEIPEGLEPDNQDGEVEGFDCVPARQLVESLQAGVFTLEAALVHVHWLRRHKFL